ncbi:MAG: hypothetical protein V3V18_07290 [Methylococcales bacterium]
MNRQTNADHCGRTYSLYLALIISQLFIGNTVLADTATTDDKNDNWFAGTWLDGSWMPQTVQIHGFLSQGFVHTSDNNFFGKSDDSVSTNYRELGINGSWRVIPELQLSMQVVYRDAGKTDDLGVRIDYGFADYSFYSTESTLLGLKGGRVPTPLGFYNESRDVLSSRSTILLPQSMYFDKNRNLALSADGGYLHGEHRTELGDFFFDFGAVIPHIDDPDAKFAITRDLPGKVDGKTSWIGRIAYEWQSGRVRTSITYADFNVKYKSENAVFESGRIQFNPLIFSAQYNGEDWSLTGEYAFTHRHLNDFGAPLDSNTTSIGYYIQGTYQFTSWMEGVIRYDELVIDKDDSNGKQFSASTGGLVPAHARFAEDLTFGLRFTLIPNLLFSAEYHHINGTGWLADIENKDRTKTRKRWNMFLWMVSYNF